MTETSPAEALRLAIGAHYLARSVHVAAALGIADHLDDQPKPAAELASAVNAHPDALARMLRLLCAHGVFEQRGEAFAHSQASKFLRSDHPHSLRPLARMMGGDLNWATWAKFEQCVRTGEPASLDIAPEGRWKYLADHPVEAEIFDEAMTAKSHESIEAILAAYDFSGFGVIGDIGGGRGHLLQAILKAAPKARGVLFDLPHVVERAAGAASDRLTLMGGDFFKDAPPACDCYVMMDIIHDWDDANAAAILSAVRRAAPRGAKLLLLEEIIADSPDPSFTKMIDLVMMVAHGGRQRTRSEFEALYEKAGFRLTRLAPTSSNFAIIEGV